MHKKLCEKKYDATALEQIREAIEDLYYFEFVIGLYIIVMGKCVSHVRPHDKLSQYCILCKKITRRLFRLIWLKENVTIIDQRCCSVRTQTIFVIGPVSRTTQ